MPVDGIYSLIQKRPLYFIGREQRTTGINWIFCVSSALTNIIIESDMDAEVSVKERFAQLSHCLSEPSPFLPDAPLDESTPEAFYGMSFPILVIGAGGLGC